MPGLTVVEIIATTIVMGKCKQSSWIKHEARHDSDGCNTSVVSRASSQSKKNSSKKPTRNGKDCTSNTCKTLLLQRQGGPFKDLRSPIGSPLAKAFVPVRRPGTQLHVMSRLGRGTFWPQWVSGLEVGESGVLEPYQHAWFLGVWKGVSLCKGPQMKLRLGC